MIEETEKETNAKKPAASRVKYLFNGDKDTKLSVQIKQKTFNLIEDYRNFHKHISGEEVSLDTLISAIITSGMTSDKTFVKWRKKEAEKKQKKKQMKKRRKNLPGQSPKKITLRKIPFSIPTNCFLKKNKCEQLIYSRGQTKITAKSGNL